MYKICVFAGTTEGRELVEFLTAQAVSVTACVATEYGEALLSPAENLRVLSGRLSMEEMAALVSSSRFDLVVDATHPYAAAVTENIASACESTGTEYLRLLREGSALSPEAVYVPDISGAVAYLNGRPGNILLTTGSKELALYTGIADFAQRIYARVLPLGTSLEACREAGLKPGHIIAMQGPFSQELNTALLRAVSARFLVTKDGGEAGGFDAKAAAARKAGAQLIVIGRPPQREGLSFSETAALLCRRFGCEWRPKVSVVGMGPGSADAMTAQARRAMERAGCLIGAKRMLEAAALPGQKRVEAIAPEAIAGYILEHREHGPFAVVMSGDVGFFSGTKKLLPLLSGCEVTVLPGISSLVYLCARLHTPYEDVVSVSLHGRDHDIVPDVRNNRRVFALVGGDDGINRLCRGLAEAGLGNVKVSVGQCLSYPGEKITSGTASALAEGVYEPLSVALIENPQADPAVAFGLPDEAFQRGGGEGGVVPMTKSEVRAVCLSKLRLTRGAVCWDVGAGTGSVATEMALQAANGHVYAIEGKASALELLKRNRERFRAENLTVVGGMAPEVCRDLPSPSHVFIGGSGGKMREILALVLEKNPAARIVATAVSLESVAELTACMQEFPFTHTEVVSLCVARDRKAGNYHLMTGQNPIYIFTMEAGGEDR